MKQQVYYSSRNIVKDDGVFEAVKSEFIQKFIAGKALLDAELDKVETYKYDANGFKVLEETAEPIRTLEINHLILKNDIVVGSVILRVTNKPPTHGNGLIMDCLDRTYELRFRTFAGCDFTVESAGIAISQTNKGLLKVNSPSITSFSEKILERHWQEFKSECDFTATEVANPTRKSTWSKLNVLTQYV